jgi:glycosyltransferase involved in cell wall biosynthesis
MTSTAIVIPCHNHARFLDDAIRSVIAQTRSPVEVIVVDDGSTDDTGRIARSYTDIRYVRQSQRGLAGARNRGLREVSAEYVVFLDADDRLLPSALEIGIGLLNERRDLALVAGRCTLIGPDGSRLYTPAQEAVEDQHYARLLSGNVVWCPASVMYRRSVLSSVWGFDPQVDAAADYDMYLRLARTAVIHVHRAVVAEYRQHGGNMSSDAVLMLSTIRHVLARQEAYIGNDPDLEAARRRGIDRYELFYSDELLDEMRRHFARRARAIEQMASSGEQPRSRFDGVRELERLYRWSIDVFSLKSALATASSPIERDTRS